MLIVHRGFLFSIPYITLLLLFKIIIITKELLVRLSNSFIIPNLIRLNFNSYNIFKP